MNLIYCILEVKGVYICVREIRPREFVREYLDDQGICQIQYILDSDFVAPRLQKIISKEEYYCILESEAIEYQDKVLQNLITELKNRKKMIKKSKNLIAKGTRFLIDNM